MPAWLAQARGRRWSGALLAAAGAAAPIARGEGRRETPGDSSCWVQGYDWEICCAVNHGPQGNAQCWDSQFSFERCCFLPEQKEDAECTSHARDEPPVAESLTEGPSTLGRGIGLFQNYLPEKDCWRGERFSHEGCCDLRLSPKGDVSCWDAWHSFERCCVVTEQPVVPAPVEAAALPRLPVGDECWVGDFTWYRCCRTEGSGCWDAVHTQLACCQGIQRPRPEWTDIPREHAWYRCLSASAGVALEASAKLGRCSGRYFYLAFVSELEIGSPLAHWPWWRWVLAAKEEAEAAVVFQTRPLRPSASSFVGGMCLPKACDHDTAAAHLAPRLAPWWSQPPRVPVELNSTHAQVPPPLALRRPYDRFKDAWVAPRPWHADDARPDHVEFLLTEHRGEWLFGPCTQALGMLACPALVGALAACCAGGRCTCAVDTLSPCQNLRRLGRPRGPPGLDTCRVLLGGCVLYVHVVDHGAWLSIADASGARWISSAKDALHRVNIGFLVLTCYLNVARRGVGRSSGPASWLGAVLGHLARRWLSLAPLAAVWTYMYVCVFASELPMNGMLKSRSLFLWYSVGRDSCAHPAHLWPSLLLVHDAVFATRSPCHNVDIFEGLLEAEVAVFALSSAFGGRGVALAAAALWAPAVLWDRSQVEPGTPFDGSGHRFCTLLPTALACVFLAAALPIEAAHDRAADRDAQALPSRSWARSAPLGGLLVSLSMLQDLLTTGTPHSGGPLCGFWLAARLQALHAPGRDYVVACHLYELVFVLGLLLLLRAADDGQKRGVGESASEPAECWCCFRALARLMGGINVAGLFVLHYAAGYLHQEPLEATPFTMLAVALATLAVSAALSLALFVLVEGPISAALSRRWAPPHGV